MPARLIYSDIRVINELTAAQLTVHNEYNLPLTDGTANQVMATDGAGQVQFVDLASISPTPISISDGTGINWSLDGSVYTGTVTLSPFSTTNLAEGTNLYFTNERVDDRVSTLIQNGTGISWSYNDAGDSLTPAVTLAPFSTTNLAEGTNQYFTAQRVFTALLPAIVNAAPSPSNPIVWQYNAGPKTILPKVSLDPFDTDDLSEGSTNCYHTTNRAQDAAAAIFTSNPGLHTGIAFSYNTSTNEMAATVSPVPIEVQCNGTACGTQSILNFCTGNDISLTVAEDVINGCVSIQIDSCVCNPLIILGAGTCSTYRRDTCNVSTGDYSTVSGGYGNVACENFSTIGGGECNCADSKCATVSGGSCNRASLLAFVGGGVCNSASGDYSTVSGGYLNVASGNHSTIGGGCNNSASGYLSTISGGCCNTACGVASAVFGGSGNLACNDYSGVFGCNITTVAACTFHVNNLAITTKPTLAPASIAVLTRNQTTGVVDTRYMGGLYSQIANSSTVTNTTTPTSIVGTGCGTLTIAANSFTTGDAFTALLGGRISTGTDQTIAFQLTSGATLLAETDAISLASRITDCEWNLRFNFTIRAVGAATVASIHTAGQFNYDDGTQIRGVVFNTLNNATFNTTVSNTLDVVAIWGAANASNKIVGCDFILTKTY